MSAKKQPSKPIQKQTMPTETVPKEDMEKIIASIDPAFFAEEFDEVKYLFDKDFSDAVTGGKKIDEIEKEYLFDVMEKYQRAKEAVDQKLAQTVMSNYNSFVQGMSQVQEVGMDLTMTTVMCKNGRRRLQRAQENLVTGGLTILAKYRKRKALMNLVYFLTKIQELQRNEKMLYQLVSEGDFPAAIQLMITHRANLVKLKQFSAVKELGEKVQKGYEHIEKQIDTALESVCASFDSKAYERILIAHKLLGNSQLPAKIAKYYQTAIDSLLKDIVQSFALKNAKQQPEQIIQKGFNDLCKIVPPDEVLSCLLSIFSMVSDVMYNFYCIHMWHTQRKEFAETNKEQEERRSDTYDYDAIRNFIWRYRKTMWADNIQPKISAFLSFSDFSRFKIERFLQVFHAVSMFCEFGEEFSEGDAYKLRGALKTKSKLYFMNFHREVLDQFRSMIDFEGWQRLDLDPSYGMSDINKELRISNRVSFSRAHSSIYQEYATKVRQFLKSNDFSSNPFRKAAERGSFELSQDQDNKNKSTFHRYEYSDDESSEDEEDSDDEATTVNGGSTPKKNQQKKHKKEAPVFTNVSHSIMTRFGVYLHAMEILQPINLDVFFAFTTLYRFYMYSVFNIFGPSNPTMKEPYVPENDTEISESLRSTLKTIRDSLNKCNEEAKLENVQFKIPKLSEMIDISKPPSFGLYEKIVAVESMVFLFEVVKNISPRLAELIPKNKAGYLDVFMKSMESACQEIRTVVYSRALNLIINLEPYTNQIANSKYNNTKVGDPSPFVASMKGDLKNFAQRMETIEEKIPYKTTEYLWDVVIKSLVMILVEGFSRVKKCSLEGRGAMQLDFTTLNSYISSISPLKPPPYSAYVKNYLQAFYWPAEDFYELALEAGQEYTYKQLLSVFEVGPGASPTLKKQDKTSILTKLKELEKRTPAPLIGISNPAPTATTTGTSAPAPSTNGDTRTTITFSSDTPADPPKEDKKIPETPERASMDGRPSLDGRSSTPERNGGGMKKSPSIQENLKSPEGGGMKKSPSIQELKSPSQAASNALSDFNNKMGAAFAQTASLLKLKKTSAAPTPAAGIPPKV